MLHEQRDAAADFVRRCRNHLNGEDAFGYSLEEGRSRHHGDARRINRHSFRLVTDCGNAVVTAVNEVPDPFAHLTSDQVAELRRAAITMICKDLDGAASDQAEHWAEMYLADKANAATYLGVLDWSALDADERAKVGLTFNPATGRPNPEN